MPKPIRIFMFSANLNSPFPFLWEKFFSLIKRIEAPITSTTIYPIRFPRMAPVILSPIKTKYVDAANFIAANITFIKAL